MKKRKHKMKLGFSPVQATAAGAGFHEPKKKQKRRKERRSVKRRLKGGDWE